MRRRFKYKLYTSVKAKPKDNSYKRAYLATIQKRNAIIIQVLIILALLLQGYSNCDSSSSLYNVLNLRVEREIQYIYRKSQEIGKYQAQKKQLILYKRTTQDTETINWVNFIIAYIDAYINLLKSYQEQARQYINYTQQYMRSLNR